MHRRLLVLLALGLLVATSASAASATPRRTVAARDARSLRGGHLAVVPAHAQPGHRPAVGQRQRRGRPARYTSPTNIGAYLWSTLAARDLGIITPAEARTRIARTLESLARLERHAASGQFYNWYDPDTGAKLRVLADRRQHASTRSSRASTTAGCGGADHGAATPCRSARADASDPRSAWTSASTTTPRHGLIRGGFWDEPPPGCSVLDNYRDRGPTSPTRATTTGRSTPSRGSRATSALPRADPALALLPHVAHASRTRATGRGRRCDPTA